MSAYVPIAELAGCVFPYRCQHREYLVLKAYLDDSGTHDTSDVIVMGGLIATDEACATLEPAWDALLTKYRIAPAHAHMNRCKHRSASSFRGWSDYKRHRALTQFRRLIVDTGGRMLASAVSRRDWDAVCAKSRLGEFFVDPIDFLQAACLRDALESRRKNLIMGQERVSVVFDFRLQSYVRWNWNTLGFQKKWPNRFVGFNFSSSEEVLPLQAADMIAYESFVFQCDRVKQGTEPKPRPNFGRLLNALANKCWYVNERHLLDYARKLESGLASKGL